MRAKAQHYFVAAADLGDGGDGDGFGGVAEGGDDALFLGGEAGEEVAEDELEGIIESEVPPVQGGAAA